MDKAILSRLYQYIKKDENGCWLWTGGTRGPGYGRIKISGRSMQAHRVSYEHHVGKIPEGMLVCHACDIPGCINPSHLFLGTQKDNLADMIKKGRSNYARGEGHGSSKLTDRQALEIYNDQRSHTESFHSSFKRKNRTVMKIRPTCRLSQITARIILHNRRRLSYFNKLDKTS